MFSSCINNKNDSIENADFQIDINSVQIEEISIPDLSTLNSVFPKSKFEVIALEFTPNSLLGEISKVIYADNKYIVLDESSGTLFAFANNGKYLFTVGSKGSGPDQYVRVKGFDLDVDSGEIVVLDIAEKIIHYNLRNGAYLKDYRLEDMPYAKLADIKLIGKDTIFLAKGKSSEILFPFDLIMIVNEKVVSGGFLNTSPMDTVVGDFPSQWFSSSIEDEFTFISPYFQEIYFIKDNKVSRSFQLDMGDKMLSKQEEEMLQGMSRLESNAFIRQNKKFGGFLKIFLNKDHFLFISNETGEVAFSFKTGHLAKFENNYPAFSLANVVGTYNGKIISTINGESFYSMHNRILDIWRSGLNNDKLYIDAFNYVSELYPDWAKTVELMKNSDNPLLIIGEINFGEPEYEPANFVPNWSNDFNIYVQKHK